MPKRKVISINKPSIPQEPPLLRDIVDETVYNVTSLNTLLGDSVRHATGGGAFWVEGEITDFTAHTSGHWYFTLRDENSEIRATCWRSAVAKMGGFVPESGMLVLCRCRADFYEKRGTVNISVHRVEPKGVGAEAAALKKLLEKLDKEGLFSEDRKKPLPFLCRKIGVVTAPQGAALQDIIAAAQNRFPNIHITVSPARVQGKSAPDEIARALSRFEGKDVDAVILARGGGSGEDLSAFNTEKVARAVAGCGFPVVSAVGHEIDKTASDLAADRRAATPSAAAEMVVPVKDDILRGLTDMRGRLSSALSSAVSYAEMEVDGLSVSLLAAAGARVETYGYEIGAAAARLDALSPLAILGRGYAVAYKGGKAVTDSGELSKGDELDVRFAKGKAKVKVEGAG